MITDSDVGNCSGGWSTCQSTSTTCTTCKPLSSNENDQMTKDDDMYFCMSNYAKEALKMMFMMRSHNMLTDVILEVKQEIFPAHKVVLSAASPYFKAMFTGGMKESEMSRIQLQGVSITIIYYLFYIEYRYLSVNTFYDIK